MTSDTRFPVWLEPGAPFPDPETALRDPNGLLALGGDLTVGTLLRAYRSGIFPWYGVDQPILWWSPDPRAVLNPRALRISRSLRKRLAKTAAWTEAGGDADAARDGQGERHWRVSVDRAFDAVVAACAAPRESSPRPAPAQDDAHTWIVPAMREAYAALHRAGHAHSIEVWDADRLVGGLYGVAVGRVFCGESMFHRETEASKVALAWLCAALIDWGYTLIDVQQDTAHLRSLGAVTIPRREYLTRLRAAVDTSPQSSAWSRIAAHPLNALVD